ncbi:hypothetical protein WMF20_07120 [Sorangium sp. So ce834]|uniref:hypothetical protein n=1 Tax=Sorangium sp. So ce834 TaxID=3133321 RepID=UPI003F644AC1
MTEPEVPPREGVTAWHPMLVALLEFYLPSGWRLYPELLLNRMPLRVDIVVLRLADQPAGDARKLHSIFGHLRQHTLIEHKGPTDDLEPEDVLTLLAYGALYMRHHKLLDPDELCLMVIADRIPAGFARQVERHRGSFAPVGGGLWRGELNGLLLHGVEAREACRQSPTEHLLYMFSRAYLKGAGQILPLDPEEARVYNTLYQQVEQFRRQRGTMAMKDYELARHSYEEVLEQMLAQLPPERLLAKLTPEQRLEGLTPEQRFEGLTPEQRFEGLTPEQRFEGLTPEEILRAIPPEVRELIAKKLSRGEPQE